MDARLRDGKQMTITGRQSNPRYRRKSVSDEKKPQVTLGEQLFGVFFFAVLAYSVFGVFLAAIKLGWI